jgi:hypothetical protein
MGLIILVDRVRCEPMRHTHTLKPLNNHGIALEVKFTTPCSVEDSERHFPSVFGKRLANWEFMLQRVINMMKPIVG